MTATVLRRRPRRRRAARAIVLAMVVLARRDGQADETHVVRYDGDALTVRLRGVPISEVLQELAVQAGAEVRGQVREQRDVTATFDAVPLPEALSRLLGNQDYALVYRGGRLKAVRLLGSDAVMVAAPAPPTGERPPFPGPLPRLIDRHPPIPVTGVLAEALGSNVATLRQLLDLTLHHPDAVVRSEALRTGLTTVQDERELYVAVVAELDHTDGGVVASLLRTSGTEHAEELAREVVQGGYPAKFRLMASSVLQRLHSGD